MAKFRNASEKKIAQTFEMLAGKEVSISGGGDIAPDSCYSAGLYVDNDGKIQAACLFDLPLSAYTSAALSMIGMGVVEDSIKSGSLNDNLKENLHEIFNIGAAFFNEYANTGIRIKDTHILPDKIPDPLVAVLGKSSNQAGYDVKIEGYGDGKLRLYVL